MDIKLFDSELKIKKTSLTLILIGIVLITVVVSACAITVPDTEEKSAEILVYVESFDGTTLAFDEVEWVTVPSERATELNITDDDAPSGFYVYNEAATVEEFHLAESCVCRILDWTDNYVQIDVTPEELTGILEERKGTNIPYHVVIENNEIVEIFEQYVP